MKRKILPSILVFVLSACAFLFVTACGHTVVPPVVEDEITYTIEGTTDHTIKAGDTGYDFLNGVIANDHDIEYIFIDGAARIAKVGLDGMKNLFEILDKNKEINFILTISSDYDNIPPYIKKYIK